MRIVIAIFGFVSLAVALFVILPAKFSPETSLPKEDNDREPHFLTEVVSPFLPKGDRLAAPRSEVGLEVEVDDTEVEAEVADLRQPEGPPLPPPDLPIETLCHTLASVAQANGLPTGFFARLIWQESKLNQRIVSHAGAQGVAQFMPAVAAERGLLNPFDPLAALPHSARFLKEHVQYFGNLGLAAAAYNAGTRRVTEWLARRGRLPEETRQYVKIITGNEPERWTESKEIDMPLALPKQNPCDGVADLSRGAEPTKVAVQLEPPVQKIIEAARIAAAKAAEAKAKKLASLKSKRGRLLAKLPGGKRKAKAVAEKSVDKPHGSAGKLPPKIADRVTDKPKGRVRLADAKR
ncbi:MAG: lytic transglycosylase domain-containing protein [Pseudorhodoplanes sp.]